MGRPVATKICHLSEIESKTTNINTLQVCQTRKANSQQVRSLAELGSSGLYVGSVVDLESDMRGAVTLSDPTDDAWEALFVPSSSSHRDPNRAPTEVAPSTPVP